MRDAAAVFQDPAIFFQKRRVDKVVILKSSKGAGIVRWAIADKAKALHRGQSIFPSGPSAGGFLLFHRDIAEQAAVISGNKIAAFVWRDRRNKAGPKLGVKGGSTAAIEPVKLGLGCQKDATQYDMAHPRGVADGVDQCQGRTPAAAKDHELLDLQGLPDRFDIADQMPCCVVLDRGQGPRAAATALIKQHNAVNCRIKIAPHRWAAPTARAAVQDQDRNALRVATLLDIDAVAIAHIHHALVEGVDRRVKIFNCALLT